MMTPTPKDGPGNDRAETEQQPSTALEYIDDRLAAWERYPEVKTLGELEARLAEERRKNRGN
jgi:hypothetical protein